MRDISTTINTVGRRMTISIYRLSDSFDGTYEFIETLSIRTAHGLDTCHIHVVRFTIRNPNRTGNLIP